MVREITQRALRNDSGEIMRRLDESDAFIVTRNGVPVGELSPLRRHRFVSAEAVVALFQHAPAVDAAKLREDLDRVGSQHPTWLNGPLARRAAASTPRSSSTSRSWTQRGCQWSWR